MDGDASQQLANALRALPENAWTQGPVTHARGRSAKDPNAVTTQFTVSALEDFEIQLKNYLESRSRETAEHEEVQFSFWIGTSFLVFPPAVSLQERVASKHQQDIRDRAQQNQAVFRDPNVATDFASAAATQADQENVAPNTIGDARLRSDPKISLSIMEALQSSSDPKDRMRKQRAIAKACVDVIQKVDGFRYSFHNSWQSREDDAYRFSYYCNDSLLNKDRAANGKGQKVGKRATKPVYDCKGVLSVKFSATKQSLEVHYKHNPIHKTYEERAPPPRQNSKRRQWYEEHAPNAIPVIQRKKAREERRAAERAEPKKKRVKKDKAANATSSIESDLRTQSLQSLLSLIQTGPMEPADTMSAALGQLSTNSNAPSNDRGKSQNASSAGSTVKRKPKSSCTECRSRKTKCDAGLPICKSCLQTNRRCVYVEGSDDQQRRQSMPVTQTSIGAGPSQPIQIPDSTVYDTQSAPTTVQKPVNNAPAAPEQSELEKMRAELAAAQRKIAQLEAQNAASPVRASPAAISNSMTPLSATRTTTADVSTDFNNNVVTKKTPAPAVNTTQFSHFQTPTQVVPRRDTTNWPIQQQQQQQRKAQQHAQAQAQAQARAQAQAQAQAQASAQLNMSQQQTHDQQEQQQTQQLHNQQAQWQQQQQAQWHQPFGYQQASMHPMPRAQDQRTNNWNNMNGGIYRQ